MPIVQSTRVFTPSSTFDKVAVSTRYEVITLDSGTLRRPRQTVGYAQLTGVSSIVDAFSGAVDFTMPQLGGLAHSTTGVGCQAAIIDNTATRYQDAFIYCRLRLGTSPSGNSAIYVYLIRDNGGTTPLRTDGAGGTAGSITIRNAPLIGVLTTGAAPATGEYLEDSFWARRLGPKWTIAIVNMTGVALDATAANHTVNFVGVNPQVV